MRLLLNSLHIAECSTVAERNEHFLTPPKKGREVVLPLLHSYTSQSAVQRRTADSYGKSGQGETLQACRSGSPHAPWKADVRSGTEQTIPFFTPNKKGVRGLSSTTTLVHTTECSAAEDGRLPRE
ncbi:hypothetical protein RKD55_000753 [Rossellomorea marisflavi]